MGQRFVIASFRKPKDSCEVCAGGRAEWFGSLCDVVHGQVAMRQAEPGGQLASGRAGLKQHNINIPSAV